MKLEGNSLLEKLRDEWKPVRLAHELSSKGSRPLNHLSRLGFALFKLLATIAGIGDNKSRNTWISIFDRDTDTVALTLFPNSATQVELKDTPILTRRFTNLEINYFSKRKYVSTSGQPKTT